MAKRKNTEVIGNFPADPGFNLDNVIKRLDRERRLKEQRLRKKGPIKLERRINRPSGRTKVG